MTVVSDFVSLAARSCESILNESTGTIERLVESLGHLWGDNPGRPPFDPWWAGPEGDERFVDLAQWDPAPAGPWGAC